MKRRRALNELTKLVEEWEELPNTPFSDVEKEEKEKDLDKRIAKWADRVVNYQDWGAWT